MPKEHIAYPDSVDRLIAEFASLPGIGRRSAERLAFHMLKASPEDAMRLAVEFTWWEYIKHTGPPTSNRR